MEIPRQKIGKNKEKLDDILRSTMVDTSKPVDMPPIILYVRENMYSGWQRLFTLGNFSAIIGKAKSRKTFFTSLIVAALNTDRAIYNTLKGNLPEKKHDVVRIDTEQSYYDVYYVTKRDEKLSRNIVANYQSFALREYSPLERCDIIEHLLERFQDKVGFVIIDGIADLATAINDELEATRVTSLLLKWTKQYNCHISVIIHQNKSNNFATGHLGSSIMKKSEVVISVDKADNNPTSSVVSCNLIRGVGEFEPFTFFIDGNGMPVIYGAGGVDTSFEAIFDET